MARRTPRAVMVTAMLGALVFAGAVGGAALTRVRTALPGTPSVPSAPQQPTADPAENGCLREPCRVLGAATLGDTRIELVADSGALTGRLRIGSPGASRVIEVGGVGRLMDSGALQCYPASISACLVRAEGEQGLTGTVVVGRSDKWSKLERAYLSTAGYLGLNNVVSDSGPEVITAQCADDACGGAVFAQVFTLTGAEVGCTRRYSSLDGLPGYPSVTLSSARLAECG